MQKPPGVTSTERLSHRFSCRIAPGKISQLEHLNYIIPEASWQGAYFLYLFLGGMIMAKAKYTRGSDGYWRTKAWDGTYNSDGTKHRINLKSAKSSADLERQVNTLKRDVENGRTIKTTDITFCEYAHIWLQTYKAVRSGNTRRMYSNIINKHLSTLEGVKLRDIRKMHFQLVINSALDHPRTCQQIKITFRQVIKAAIADRYLPDGALRNICEDIELPKYRAKEKRPLSDLERMAVRKADFSPMERAFIYIIYGCGLRRSEALALRRIDIDLQASELAVSQALEFEGNNPSTKPPKSDNGYRRVPMPPFLTNHLKDYLPTVKGDYLFHSRYGRMMTLSGYRRMWERILLKMNLAAGGTENLWVIHGLTAHIFRHNYCTELCYQVPAISTKKIAQLLGDDEKMVLEVYSHVVEKKENTEEVITKAIAL